jgi:uncharacterized protein (TIGR03382 family)
MDSRTMQMRIAATVAILGFAMMLGMMYLESEPGAIPLALIVVGVGWWLFARRRRPG